MDCARYCDQSTDSVVRRWLTRFTGNLLTPVISETLQMLKFQSFLTLASAVLILGSGALAQDCSTCGGSFGSSQFGYPSTGGSCGCGVGGGSHHERMDAIRAENAKITARNDAWPKPFSCADRQLYQEIWAPMIDQGFEEQCLLSSEHFDASNHTLNRLGMSAVAGIMQNMPSHRKHVFINRDIDETVSQARWEAVNSTVRTYYGQIAPNAQVAFSNKQPSSVSGAWAEAISNKYLLAAPAPVIPISSGKQTVASSVGQ